MENEVFMLYANCVITQGHSRATICDLQRHKVHLIPTSLADFFREESYLIIDPILQELDIEERETFMEYLNFLLMEELGFFCYENNIPLFPKISKEWQFPAHISNCILDADNKLWYFNSNLLSMLDELCCDFIQIRFYSQTTFDHLSWIFQLISESKIKAVEILIAKENTDSFYLDIQNLVTKFPQIQTVFIHSDSASGTIRDAVQGMGQIICSTTKITNELHCGIVSALYFASNISHYTESQLHNTCLNRKISIDVDGNIKNCPSMKESFGNINNTTLAEAVKKPDFKEYWGIKRDEITICKDCEFRHVCTDCRAYIENPIDAYSKPLKCGYNPYTCEWEEWSTLPMKQQAIEYYGLKQ